MNITCLRCRRTVSRDGSLQIGDGEYICSRCRAWAKAKVAEIVAWREECGRVTTTPAVAAADGLPKEGP